VLCPELTGTPLAVTHLGSNLRAYLGFGQFGGVAGAGARLQGRAAERVSG
jgi:hypothetical protein